MAFQTIDPSNGKWIRNFENTTETEIEHALSQAQTRFTEDWRFRSHEQRAEVVRALANEVRVRADELAKLATCEVGKLLAEARWEVNMMADVFDYAAAQGPKTLATAPLPGVPGAVISNEPLGILLAIEPWNYPYLQVARVIGPQLMAGNVLVVKHSENVPQCAIALQELFERSNAPSGLYSNLFIDVERADALLDDDRVQGVTLTGSDKGGAIVAARAGKNLKKAVLELGGTDPFIVLEDAPFGPTLDNAVYARMENTGQSCVAGKRFIIVGKSRGQKFTDALVKRFKALKPGDPTAKDSQFGPLATKSALDRLMKQIQDATAAGARVLTGGKPLDRPGFYIEPTVITDISPENPVYQQELFGPVASVYIVSDEEEAIALANATPYGLGAAIFSSDTERATKLAHRIDSGMVFINNPTWIAPNMPFGGVKRSGYGRELSELGFTEFVNRKLIRIYDAGTPAPA